jgi:Tol biopolymer transport system component
MLRVHRQFIVLRYTASHTASGKRRRAETLYRVARKSADLLKMSLVTVAAMLAICLLALVETTNTAEAKDSLPQNGKIAFIRSLKREQGGTYYIYTVNPDGSSLSRRTNGIPKFPNLLAWSPDGTQIAFLYSLQIWTIGADGSNLRTLTPNKLHVPDYRPRWSPDGKRLAFVGSASEYQSDIYTVDLDGSDITNITNTPEVSEAQVDVSPDGSQMCLHRFTEPIQREGIYVMNDDASNPTQLTDYHGWECAWSPDGTKIAY